MIKDHLTNIFAQYYQCGYNYCSFISCKLDLFDSNVSAICFWRDSKYSGSGIIFRIDTIVPTMYYNMIHVPSTYFSHEYDIFDFINLGLILFEGFFIPTDLM